MAILIGIKKEHSSGSYHGTEGLEGFSMNASSIDIIKEGNRSGLEYYVKMAKESAENARKAYRKLEDEIEYSDMSMKKYEQLCDEYLTKMRILNYEKLLIVEGIVL